MENYKFINNEKCEFFPCHKTDDKENFNCLFCYCPLYLMEEKCGGNFTYTKNGIKDCSNCLLPHKRENYDHINNKLYDFTLSQNKERFSKINAVATDLDHTLIKEEFAIDDISIETFKKLREKGYKTIVATARGFYQAFNFTSKLKPDYIICDNGASVVEYDYENNKKNILLEKVIPQNIIKDIFTTLKDNDIPLFLLESDKKLFITDNKYAKDFVKSNVDFFSPISNLVNGFTLEKINSIKDFPTNLPLTRICTFDFVGDEKTRNTLAELGKKHSQINYSQTFTRTFEFGCSDKGKALDFLMNYANIKKEELMSFGDSLADIPLLDKSGIPVAVDNAREELKEHAMYIADSVFDNGVDKFIKENLLNE